MIPGDELQLSLYSASVALPTEEEIVALLNRLHKEVADSLETEVLEFKPWISGKESLQVAVEYAVCFANAYGGVIIFGVADHVRGRSKAIHGAAGYDLDTWRRGIFDATSPHVNATVNEVAVPEGTGKLLLVRVSGSGPDVLHGTSAGVFKRRVGKNCMPLDAQAFMRTRVSTGTLDWSGQQAGQLEIEDLDPVEIARARNLLRRTTPESDLLRLPDREFLAALGAVRAGKPTNAGCILLGREELIREHYPQQHVHYVQLASETSVTRNDSFRGGLLSVIERVEQIFVGPANPEQELSVGFLKIRIPAFPVDAVRESILNALTHRDYLDPGEVLIRHTSDQLVVTNPGGFLGGITPQNILRQEPISRNPTLAQAFEKLRLVERAGVGRRRIFIPLLSYGKRAPEYSASPSRVTLRIFDGSFDEQMAALVAKWRQDGREVDLDGLLLLSFLREHEFIDTIGASHLLQLSRDDTRGVLDFYAQPRNGILERRGRTKAATFHLTKSVAKDLLGKAAYTKTKGLNPIRYAEMVKTFVNHHGSITPQEARELLGLGESQSARVEVSRYLRQWSGAGGFLRREGKASKTRYYPKRSGKSFLEGIFNTRRT